MERNASLDDITEEDVEEGRLNDDQLQAMWGKSLEEAQSWEHRFIAAYVVGHEQPRDPALARVSSR